MSLAWESRKHRAQADWTAYTGIAEAMAEQWGSLDALPRPSPLRSP